MAATKSTREFLSHERLKQVFHYDPDTGVFTRLVAITHGGVGPVNCAPNSAGYLRIRHDKRTYQAHRLAWFYVHGCWPISEVDHINGDRTDNRLSNLREATKSQNQRNARLRKDNSCGLKGVTWHKLLGKWRAQIRTKETGTIILGAFDSVEAAHAAYCDAARELFGEFANEG